MGVPVQTTYALAFAIPKEIDNWQVCNVDM